jgi:hypothetical protein
MPARAFRHQDKLGSIKVCLLIHLVFSKLCHNDSSFLACEGRALGPAPLGLKLIVFGTFGFASEFFQPSVPQKVLCEWSSKKSSDDAVRLLPANVCPQPISPDVFVSEMGFSAIGLCTQAVNAAPLSLVKGLVTYWHDIHQVIKHSDCPTIPPPLKSDKKDGKLCRRAGICVCNNPSLVKLHQKWSRTLRVQLAKGMPGNKAYSRGGLVLEFFPTGRPDNASTWCAMPAINLTTLVGSVMLLQELSCDLAFVRAALEDGKRVLGPLTDDPDLGCRLLFQFLSMFDKKQPWSLRLWLTTLSTSKLRGLRNSHLSWDPNRLQSQASRIFGTSPRPNLQSGRHNFW